MFKKFRISKLLLIMIFLKLLLYWNDYFCLYLDDKMFYILDIFVLLVLIFKYHKIKLKKVNVIIFSIIILFVFYILSGFINQNSLLNFVHATYVFFYGYIFYIFIDIDQDLLNFYYKLVRGFIIYGFLQHIIPQFFNFFGYTFLLPNKLIYDSYGPFLRVKNTFGGATTGAQVLFMLSIIYVLFNKQKKGKYFSHFYIIIFITLFLSFSRTVIAQTLIMTFIIIIADLANFKNKKILLKINKKHFKIIIIFILLFLLFSMNIYFNFSNFKSRFSIQNSRRLDSLWPNVINKIMNMNKKNFLFGIGFGNSFSRGWRPDKSNALLNLNLNTNNENNKYSVGAVHNSYLLIISEIGILGFFVIATLMILYLLYLFLESRLIIFPFAMLLIFVFYFNFETFQTNISGSLMFSNFLIIGSYLSNKKLKLQY